MVELFIDFLIHINGVTSKSCRRRVTFHTAVSVVTVRCTGLHSDSDYEMKGVEEMFVCVLTVCLAFTGGISATSPCDSFLSLKWVQVSNASCDL